MDDHGDGIGQDWTPWPGDMANGWQPARTPDQWLDVARYVRHSANKIGDPLPLCLPGEPHECGRSAQQHAVVWGAVLKARAHHVIEMAAPTQEYGTWAAKTHFRRLLDKLRAKPVEGTEIE
ncbi:hypothetical protein ACFWNL_29075 [Kitasatospora sp. NPDC058397]|uniref:hypothetical protein n=1 Tax=unclassified Kitasatospora TaxID=2633591 RepID=UPI003665211B